MFNFSTIYNHSHLSCKLNKVKVEISRDPLPADEIILNYKVVKMKP